MFPYFMYESDSRVGEIFDQDLNPRLLLDSMQSGQRNRLPMDDPAEPSTPRLSNTSPQSRKIWPPSIPIKSHPPQPSPSPPHSATPDPPQTPAAEWAAAAPAPPLAGASPAAAHRRCPHPPDSRPNAASSPLHPWSGSSLASDHQCDPVRVTAADRRRRHLRPDLQRPGLPPPRSTPQRGMRGRSAPSSRSCLWPAEAWGLRAKGRGELLHACGWPEGTAKADACGLI
jgi:hypothetical protein